MRACRFFCTADAKRDDFAVAAAFLFLYFSLSQLFAVLGGIAVEAGLAFLRYCLAPLAYVIPVLLAFFLLRREWPLFFVLPKKGGFADALPLLPLFLFCVMTVSYLSGLALDALGLASVGGGVSGLGFVPDLFINCLVPALLEELFFRGLILSLLFRRMGNGAVWLSAVVFALAHGSLYQLPYAFVGGVFLALAAVVGGSVFVPFAFHFANNLLSLALQYVPRGGAVVPIVLAAVALLAVGAVLYMNVRKRTRATDGLGALFATPQKDGRAILRAAFLSPLTFYVILMLLLTVFRSI